MNWASTKTHPPSRDTFGVSIAPTMWDPKGGLVRIGTIGVKESFALGGDEGGGFSLSFSGG